jgi:hypothetical protein
MTMDVRFALIERAEWRISERLNQLDNMNSRGFRAGQISDSGEEVDTTERKEDLIHRHMATYRRVIEHHVGMMPSEHQVGQRGVHQRHTALTLIHGSLRRSGPVQPHIHIPFTVTRSPSLPTLAPYISEVEDAEATAPLLMALMTPPMFVWSGALKLSVPSLDHV